MPKLPKVVIAGETTVGKSTYFLQLTDQHWGVDLRLRNPTIGCAVANVKVNEDGHVSTQTHEDGEQVVQVWDTAGQERFRSLLPMYYRGAKMAIVMHDGTQRTITTAVDLINEIKQEHPEMLIYLVQNKKDACEFNYSILDTVGSKVIGWAHVGALACDNVKESFRDAVQLMNANEPVPPPPPPPAITVAPPPARRWGGWC